VHLCADHGYASKKYRTPIEGKGIQSKSLQAEENCRRRGLNVILIFFHDQKTISSGTMGQSFDAEL